MMNVRLLFFSLIFITLFSSMGCQSLPPAQAPEVAAEPVDEAQVPAVESHPPVEEPAAVKETSDPELEKPPAVKKEPPPRQEDKPPVVKKQPPRVVEKKIPPRQEEKVPPRQVEKSSAAQEKSLPPRQGGGLPPRQGEKPSALQKPLIPGGADVVLGSAEETAGSLREEGAFDVQIPAEERPVTEGMGRSLSALLKAGTSAEAGELELFPPVYYIIDDPHLVQDFATLMFGSAGELERMPRYSGSAGRPGVKYAVNGMRRVSVNGSAFSLRSGSYIDFFSNGKPKSVETERVLIRFEGRNLLISSRNRVFLNPAGEITTILSYQYYGAGERLIIVYRIR